MMSVDTARDSEIGRLVSQDPMLKTMSNVTLALHLLLEKTSPASFWEPYINTLPHEYSTVLYFGKEDFDALRGSPAYEDALKQYKFVARQYAYFYRKFQTTILKDYFTYDEYRWAVSTVMTRQNQVRSQVYIVFLCTKKTIRRRLMEMQIRNTKTNTSTKLDITYWCTWLKCLACTFSKGLPVGA